MPNWDGKLIYWTLATVVVKGVDMACNQSQSSILLFKFQRTNGTMELIPIQYFEPIAEQMTSGGHSHSGLWTNHWADDVTYRILVCKKMDPLHCEQSLFFVRFSESSARAREGHSRETRETRAAAREKKRDCPQSHSQWNMRWPHNSKIRLVDEWSVDNNLSTIENDGWSPAGMFVRK